MQRYPRRDTFRIMFEKKPHRFHPNQIARWAPYPGWDHDCIIVAQTHCWCLPWIPCYTVIVIEWNKKLYGIFDNEMRPAIADLDNRSFPPLLP